jgi:hypothetical protein
MRSIALFALAAFSLVASIRAAVPQDSPTLREVFESRIEWNDKVVWVKGWVHGCRGPLFMCSLTDSPSLDLSEARLVIDYLPKMESKLRRVDGKQVLLKARVTDECAQAICTDRGPDIIPIKIQKVY